MVQVRDAPQKQNRTDPCLRLTAPLGKKNLRGEGVP